MLPAPGTVIADKYRLEQLLGEGGMGAVYRARHMLMEKRVALKWLKPRPGEEHQARQRFLREARAAARIRHPNVVDVYDIGEERGAMYMVMELLEGESLYDHLERGNVPLSETMRHILDAMRGVSAAHALRITHRDIKPDNIFIAYDAQHRDGIAKVLDFGIAKLHGETMAGLTQAGVAMGTPHYMSIEQLSGAPLDQRSDVYAFGVLLYRAVTGKMPYDGQFVGQIIAQAMAGIAARPIELVPGLSRELDRIVMRAMARVRDDRFASLDELIDALERVKSFSASPEQEAARVTTAQPTPHATRTHPVSAPKTHASAAASTAGRSREPARSEAPRNTGRAHASSARPHAEDTSWRLPFVLGTVLLAILTAAIVLYWDDAPGPARVPSVPTIPQPSAAGDPSSSVAPSRAAQPLAAQPSSPQGTTPGAPGSASTLGVGLRDAGPGAASVTPAGRLVSAPAPSAGAPRGASTLGSPAPATPAAPVSGQRLTPLRPDAGAASTAPTASRGNAARASEAEARHRSGTLGAEDM